MQYERVQLQLTPNERKQLDALVEAFNSSITDILLNATAAAHPDAFQRDSRPKGGRPKGAKGTLGDPSKWTD